MTAAGAARPLDLAAYAALDATTMAGLVRRREISPVELVESALAAQEETDGRLNAFCGVLADHARAEARACEAEAARRAFRGPLHGVPVAIKDATATAGFRTMRGSRLYAHDVPKDSAPSYSRLVAAGAVMIGKTTTPELGWKASSTSPLTGATRNPWDPRRTSGGSSAGSAAAVAAGVVPIAIGSDGGGSVRVPAAFCGIYALKATLGLVPVAPASLTEHLSHAGPLTRTVADYALALDALTGADERDPLSLPSAGARFVDAAAPPRRPLVCGYAETLFGAAVDPEVRAAVAAAAAALGAAPNIELRAVRPALEDPVATFETLWTARGAVYAAEVARDAGRFDPGFARMVRAAADISVAQYLAASQARARFFAAANAMLGGLDVLVMPTVPILPFAAERDGPDDMDPAPAVPWLRWTPFTYPFNLTGQPAASIVCGYSQAGLPIGLQIVARKFDDHKVLQVSALWEALFAGRRRTPPVHAGGVRAPTTTAV